MRKLEEERRTGDRAVAETNRAEKRAQAGIARVEMRLTRNGRKGNERCAVFRCLLKEADIDFAAFLQML